MSMSLQTKKILGGVAGLWGVLGFYRGTKYYDYTYREDMIKYNEKISEYEIDMERYNKDVKAYPNIVFRVPKKTEDKPQKYYTSTLGYGLYGSIVYLSPFPGVMFFIKEIYMLEINLRGLNDEKKKSYYNSLVV